MPGQRAMSAVSASSTAVNVMLCTCILEEEEGGGGERVSEGHAKSGEKMRKK